ncbi:hypothetical protein SDC9_99200 [bioreactor metagenome]|uniref:Uncharacterized protein n=1 Tax=bioreactor metagenome TaxID=1076179 RepID=A0A645AJG8_9ZZZZ
MGTVAKPATRLDAKFTTPIHTITAFSDTNGTITPNGNIRVISKDSPTFTFIPKIGYEVAQLLIDGIIENNPSNTYTFTNVTDDHVISVMFKK